MRSSTKLALLGSLYLSQGLPFGFFTQALPVLLRERGLSLSAIGLTSLLALPWALKFLWAPLVDGTGPGRMGRRRRWIIPLQLTAAAAMVALAWIDVADALSVLLVGVFAANMLAATQDVATDGLAVELLDYQERGLGNGIQVAGYRVGMILGGGALLMLFDVLGWGWTFGLMAIMLVLATGPVWAWDELSFTRPLSEGADSTSPPPSASPRAARQTSRHAPAAVKPSAPEPGRGLRLLLSWAQRPGMAGWLGVLLLYKTGEALATGMLRPFLVDLGLTLSDIGWLLGAVGFTAGLAGALIGGWAVGRLGRERALLAFAWLQTMAVGSYLLPALGFTSQGVLVVVCGVEHLTSGMATAALFTMMMDTCRPDSAGTDYTLQASIVVIATGVATTLSGFSADALGYVWHFIASSVISGAGLIAMALWLRRYSQRLASPSRLSS